MRVVNREKLASAVTVKQLKEQLRIEHTDEDELLVGIALAAERWVEDETETTIGTTLWTYEAADFPGVLEVGHPPVQGIKLSYRDTSGNWLYLVEDTTYYVERDLYGARAATLAGQAWPAVWGTGRCVRAEVLAGFEPGKAEAGIAAVVLFVAGYLYETREAGGGQSSEDEAQKAWRRAAAPFYRGLRR